MMNTNITSNPYVEFGRHTSAIPTDDQKIAILESIGYEVVRCPTVFLCKKDGVERSLTWRELDMFLNEDILAPLIEDINVMNRIASFINMKYPELECDIISDDKFGWLYHGEDEKGTYEKECVWTFEEAMQRAIAYGMAVQEMQTNA